MSHNIHSPRRMEGAVFCRTRGRGVAYVLCIQLRFPFLSQLRVSVTGTPWVPLTSLPFMVR